MKIKAIRAIERHQMLHPGDTVLVALSGGADSMALLHVLYSLKDEYSIKIVAAHFNHGIRGEEAKRDENFCVEVCKSLGVELFIGSADIPALAKEKGLGVEECGRKERYAFFERTAPEAKIATAHTLSDCEETFLFNLARGASLKGLGSIPPVRDNIIRPLIYCSRDDIENYCAENKISFVTDSTNLSDEYTRNGIRHNIVPQLKKINPSFDCAFERCVSNLREDEELLGILSDSVLENARTENGWLAENLNTVHPSLKRRAVAKIIEEVASQKPQAHHIEAVCDILSNGGSTQVLNAVSFCVYGGVLAPADDFADEWEQDFTAGLNFLPYETVKSAFYDKIDKINIQKFNKQLLAKAIDYDKIKGVLIFSSIKPGDKIRPKGRGVTKQLRRIFNENHVPPFYRNRISVLRDDVGAVWVSGVGADERVSADENTKRFLFIETVGENRYEE
ncbi:MAG: tRNA lysidine(34) synthetase TilS [Clostridia bacterium]|nr:tRNA lysidine(34) synthetase TilS [Clostridia bacterium]